jgi:hypothetical protein
MARAGPSLFGTGNRNEQIMPGSARVIALVTLIPSYPIAHPQLDSAIRPEPDNIPRKAFAAPPG